jgi:hypothetical protein
MKKVLLGVVFMLAFAIGTKAQVNVGIKGGANFSQLNGNNNFNSSTLVGYQAGLFARFGGSVYLQPEVYLSSTGGKFSDNNGYDANVRFTKLNVPLLVGFRFGKDDLNFRLMAGPIYSYNINTSQNLSANFNAAYADFGHYNNSTLGLQGGVGVDIGPITTDVRYEGGLSDVNQRYGQRQNLWALSVGFKFL